MWAYPWPSSIGPLCVKSHKHNLISFSTFHFYPPPLPISSLILKNKNKNKNKSRTWQTRRVSLTRSHAASITTRDAQDSYDPELRLVLELATDSELYEIESILFGPSYFSPLLKSITKREDVDIMYGIGDDYSCRQDYIDHLETRFLYLAADARSTLRGWRPTYRNVLLDVRRKLSIPCSSKLSTEDLEAEIFLHLLHESSSEESGSIPYLLNSLSDTSSDSSLEVGLGHWKTRFLSVLKVGAEEIRSIILKGGGMLTLVRIYQLLAKRLSGKMLFEAANYQIKREMLKKGGQLAAKNLEARTALLVARKGFASATSRYLGLRSLMMLLGPVLWGTFLADIVIQMIGTDYARILRAIYAFAQIRLTRTYGWASNKNNKFARNLGS